MLGLYLEIRTHGRSIFILPNLLYDAVRCELLTASLSYKQINAVSGVYNRCNGTNSGSIINYVNTDDRVSSQPMEYVVDIAVH
jgi:hypothetical protein